MENSLSIIENNSKPIGKSDTTGLNIYNSFKASSGFNYMVGMREINDLLIIEQVAEGTAITYLSGILLYHKPNKQLIKEIKVKKGVRYSRQVVVNLVSKSLLEFLIHASKVEKANLNVKVAKQFINESLDCCYFELSRKTVLEWAKSVGILKG